MTDVAAVVERVTALLVRSGGDARAEVIGDGAVARELTRRLPAPNVAHPAIVVETTGRRDGIVAALERVADLGTLFLLAGEGGGVDASVDVDLYGTVHRRGLRVVGISGPVVAGADPRR